MWLCFHQPPSQPITESKCGWQESAGTALESHTRRCHTKRRRDQATNTVDRATMLYSRRTIKCRSWCRAHTVINEAGLTPYSYYVRSKSFIKSQRSLISAMFIRRRAAGEYGSKLSKLDVTWQTLSLKGIRYRTRTWDSSSLLMKIKTLESSSRSRRGARAWKG